MLQVVGCRCLPPCVHQRVLLACDYHRLLLDSSKCTEHEPGASQVMRFQLRCWVEHPRTATRAFPESLVMLRLSHHDCLCSTADTIVHPVMSHPRFDDWVPLSATLKLPPNDCRLCASYGMLAQLFSAGSRAPLARFVHSILLCFGFCPNA